MVSVSQHWNVAAPVLPAPTRGTCRFDHSTTSLRFGAGPHDPGVHLAVRADEEVVPVGL
jgi:hypothetical protein